jgi:nitrogen fixation NifU-like protein
MTDLRDLYQQVILDHNKSPLNFREMSDASRVALGHNPLCGDRLKLFVKLDGDRIADVAFQGSGCAISKASASLMTDAVKGKTLPEAEVLYGTFHELLTGPPDVKATGAGLGKLAVFSGVREFPVRVKCATLAWHTLESALKDSHEIAKTE